MCCISAARCRGNRCGGRGTGRPCGPVSPPTSPPRAAQHLFQADSSEGGVRKRPCFRPASCRCCTSIQTRLGVEAIGRSAHAHQCPTYFLRTKGFASTRMRSRLDERIWCPKRASLSERKASSQRDANLQVQKAYGNTNTTLRDSVRRDLGDTDPESPPREGWLLLSLAKPPSYRDTHATRPEEKITLPRHKAPPRGLIALPPSYKPMGALITRTAMYCVRCFRTRSCCRSNGAGLHLGLQQGHDIVSLRWECSSPLRDVCCRDATSAWHPRPMPAGKFSVLYVKSM